MTDNAFKVTLPNRNFYTEEEIGQIAGENSPITNREKFVLSLFDNKEFIVRKEVEEGAGVSQATAIVLLRAMIQKGLIEKVGNGKQVKYRLGE